jgi:hypothetical protein
MQTYSKCSFTIHFCVYNKLYYWINSQSIRSYNFVMIFDINVKNLAKIRQMFTILATGYTRGKNIIPLRACS